MGCTSETKVVTVDHEESKVELNTGDTLIVDFGTVNHSVGDEWIITSEPDPSLMSAGKQLSKYLGGEGEAGAPSELKFEFSAKSAGSTKVEFVYEFRGAVPEDPDQQGTASIDITIAD